MKGIANFEFAIRINPGLTGFLNPKSEIRNPKF